MRAAIGGEENTFGAADEVFYRDRANQFGDA
jgi:hypothetical protein